MNAYKSITMRFLLEFGLTLCIGCTDYRGTLYDANKELYKHHCEPLLKIARTWTDTMVVYTLRPGDTYHGDPSCYELEKKL